MIGKINKIKTKPDVSSVVGLKEVKIPSLSDSIAKVGIRISVV